MTMIPVNTNPGAATSGSFALVAYLPDPLGSFLTELRQLLPGDQHADAHLTLLPPRLLWLSAADAAGEIRQLLCQVSPFELELADVNVFPDTNILYLKVATGQSESRRLHAALNEGNLSAREQFEYIPHVTISGPLQPHLVAAARQQAEAEWQACQLSKRFLVTELVLLWQPDPDSEKNWTRVSSYLLAGVGEKTPALGRV